MVVLLGTAILWYRRIRLFIKICLILSSFVRPNIRGSREQVYKILNSQANGLKELSKYLNDEAIEVTTRALQSNNLQIANRVVDILASGIAFEYLKGQICHNKGKYNDAIKHYDMAISFVNRDSLIMGKTLYAKALTLAMMKRFEEAKIIKKCAMDIFTKEKHEECMNGSEIEDVRYLIASHPEQALIKLKILLSKPSIAGHVDQNGICYGNLAEVYLALDKYENAEKYALKSLKSDKKCPAIRAMGISSNLDTLGKVYFKCGDKSPSIKLRHFPRWKPWKKAERDAYFRVAIEYFCEAYKLDAADERHADAIEDCNSIIDICEMLNDPKADEYKALKISHEEQLHIND